MGRLKPAPTSIAGGVVFEMTAARPFNRAGKGWTVSLLLRPGFQPLCSATVRCGDRATCVGRARRDDPPSHPAPDLVRPLLAVPPMRLFLAILCLLTATACDEKSPLVAQR